MTRQLTKEDILKAKAIHLFNKTTVYVELNDTEDVYGSYMGGDWFVKDNYWDYWESELMLSYFEMLTPQKTFRLFEKWQKEYERAVKKNNKLLNSAIVFATGRHAGQVRKSTNTPYILHPMEVMDILHSMKAHTNLLIAGVLHDTLEDTDTTFDELYSKFGEEVAFLVDECTEDKEQSWQDRKQHTITSVATASTDVKMLVLADKLANIRAIVSDYKAIGDDLWSRFNAPKEKQAWYYGNLQDSLWELGQSSCCSDAYWEYVALCKDVFVKYYIDEEKGIIYQMSIDGTGFYLEKDNLMWQSILDAGAQNISEKATKTNTKQYFSLFASDNIKEISRKEAEFLEDMWNYEADKREGKTEETE